MNKTFFHAHGTSTPQNRESESHIISSMSKAFGIESLPVTAIKSYLGHSLAAAGGDQMISSLGSWRNNLIPGICSTPKIADNVFTENVNFLLENLEFEDNKFDFAVLNAKGFGGNNGTLWLPLQQKLWNCCKQNIPLKKSKNIKLKNNL